MRIHYIDIFLCALNLNILARGKNKPYIKHHTQNAEPTKSHRSLCECDTYMPNYDKDPEMKEVMENFDRQTSQRFKEYNQRIMKNRQKCKEQCNKDIQKIILKDKIEKELTEKLSTLDTNIATKDIPTCVCEKSLADKTEKFCHNCGYGLGSVAPNIGLLGGPGIYVWKIAALATAKELAEKGGAAAGIKAADIASANVLIQGIKSAFKIDILGSLSLESFIKGKAYTQTSLITEFINSQYSIKCMSLSRMADADQSFCSIIEKLNFLPGPNQVAVAKEVAIGTEVNKIFTKATSTAKAAAKLAIDDTTAKLTAHNTNAVNSTYASSQIAIIASVVAILVIVLVMVIIYLILRYRRKMKIKKKLQYIKLLKE
ncbi:PIR protein, putative [Plasmodium sp.]|nr:PIR protein, putative [Plasmodium sp.]